MTGFPLANEAKLIPKVWARGIIPSGVSNHLSIPVGQQTVLIIPSVLVIVGLTHIPVWIPHASIAINPAPSSFAGFVICTQPCFTISVVITTMSYFFHNHISQKIIGLTIRNIGKYCLSSLTKLSRCFPGPFAFIELVAFICVIVCMPRTRATCGSVAY